MKKCATTSALHAPGPAACASCTPSRKPKPAARTDFAKPFFHFQQFLHRRGMVVVISDFYDDPGKDRAKPWSRCAITATKSCCSTCSIRRKSRRKLRDPVLLVDHRRPTSASKSRRTTPSNEYQQKIDAHIADLRDEARGAGSNTFSWTPIEPLDEALREYLAIRQRRM